jgi:hypothetical protein
MANTMVKNPDFSWQKSLIFSSNRLNESTVFVRSCFYHWFLMFLIYSVCIYILFVWARMSGDIFGAKFGPAQL